MVTVNSFSPPSFTANPIYCEGNQVIFRNTSASGNFIWDFGDGTRSSTFNGIHTYADTGNYTVSLLFSSAQCKDTTTKMIRIVEPPEAIFSKDKNEGCGSLTVHFTNSSSGTANSYEWDFGNGLISDLADPGPITFPGNSMADTTFYLTLSVSNTCGSSVYVDSVKVFPLPDANFGTNVTGGCSPLAVRISNVSTGGALTYKWNFGDGSAEVITTDPRDPQVSSHTFSSTAEATFTITLIAYNNCGSDTARHNIRIHNSSVHSFFQISDSAGCAPLTIQFTDFSSPGSNVLWNFGNGHTSTAHNPVYTYSSPGVYQVSQRVTNGCGRDSSFAIITVYPEAMSKFSTNEINPCSYPRNLQMNNLSTGAVGYLWDFGNGMTSQDNNPIASYSTPGTYTIQLISFSSYGCQDTIELEYTAPPLPVVSFTTPAITGCSPVSVSFYNSSSNVSGFLWNFGDGTTSTESNPTHVYTTAGMYNVTLKGASNSGCYDSLISGTSITVMQEPVAGFYAVQDLDPLLYNKFNFVNTSSADVTSYFYDLGDGFTSNEKDFVHQYNSPGDKEVILTVRNSNGCWDTSLVIVHVPYVKNLHAPNAFTPLQGSGDVTVWRPKGVGIVNYRAQVYDTYGILLWESTLLENGSPSESWNGMYRGNLMPEDVYVWKIDAEFIDGTLWEGQTTDGHGRIKKTGTVTLIK
jgi:PKD repeat protein